MLNDALYMARIVNFMLFLKLKSHITKISFENLTFSKKRFDWSIFYIVLKHHNAPHTGR